jgi:hypothetical protein
MRQRLFIGSSAENVDAAYAVQESLDSDFESTVWDQGLFGLSTVTIEQLIELLDRFEFAVFIFAPDDELKIREKSVLSVRDNVIFELGLFIGKLGRERCFIFRPKSDEKLHLPTDLLGLTTGSYDAARSDANLVAAFGPACRQLVLAAKKAKPLSAKFEQATSCKNALLTDPEDIKGILRSWMGHRSSTENTKTIWFSQVDADLGLTAGSTEKFIEQAARHWNYKTVYRGEKTIHFEEHYERDEYF